MINKIRNLLKKIIKDKKDTSSQEYEDDFTGDIEINLSEDEIIDQPLQPMTLDEDLTGEIEISNLTDQDSTGDIPAMPEEYYVSEDRTGQFDENTIDLEHGKVPFKDKMKMAFSSAKDGLSRLKLTKPKKMQVLGKEDLNSESSKLAQLTKKINLPPALKSVEKDIKAKISKINWGNIQNEFFHQKNRGIYHRTFQYTGIILLTFVIGKSVGILLSGSKDYKNLPKNASLDIDKANELNAKNVNKIKNAKLFKTEAQKVTTGKKKTVVTTDIACKTASKKSRLPIKLVNTIVLQDSVKSIASVQVRGDSLLKEFRIGDKINGLAKLDKIERSKLIVKNLQTGSCEAIENIKDEAPSPIAVMSPSKSKQFKKNRKKINGIENDGNSFSIEKSFLKDKMSNISDILTQARGIQINNPDGTISFKIVDIEPGGVFAYLGIENNDIITQINGESISDLNAVMSLFGKIGNVDKLNLTVKRGGTETPLDYKFK
jgi:type II secretory pathway component PulC